VSELADFTYSVGNCASYHEEYSRFAFPKGSHLYGEDWSCVVTDLADDYHSNHDGWESAWPLEFRIYKHGVEKARFSIEREYSPEFYALEVPIPVTSAQTPAKPSGMPSSNQGAPE
jgi:hypothetical protein